MSLELRPLIDEQNVSSAVWTHSKLVVGFHHGVVRVFSNADKVLEREIKLGRGPVTQIAAIPGSEVVAFICEKKCTVHDLSTRRVLVEVDSRSAKYVVGLKDLIVVGSDYKLRILHFKRRQFISIAVVDTVERAKVRSLGSFQSIGSTSVNGSGQASSDTGETKIYAVIGTKIPKLWRIDLSGQGRLIPVMMLDPQKFGKAHNFSLAGTADGLVIGSSTESLYLRIGNPVQIVKTLPPISAVSLVETHPASVTLLAVLTESPKFVEILNPATGTVLFKASVSPETRIVGPGLVADRNLRELDTHLSVESLTSGGGTSSNIDRTEAAKLAFTFPPSQISEAVRDLQRHEVSELFHNNEIDEAMHLLLIIEEQEPDSGPFVNNAFATQLLLPYLEYMPVDSQQQQQHGSAPNNHSAQASVHTSRTASSTRTNATAYAAAVRYHPLNSAVAFLTYARRKLRLRGSTDEEQLSNIDTALFLCFLIMRSPLLGSLLRSPNHCDPKLVQTRLLEIGRWRELVWFLKSRNSIEFHKKALNLLVEYKEPPSVILNYLSSVPDLDIVFEYAQPILQKSAGLAEDLFYENIPWEQHTDISPRIYSFLHDNVSPKSADDFALFRVCKRGDQSPELHTQVALILAERSTNGDGKSTSDASNELLSFLDTSRFLNAAQLLRTAGMPLEGQAILQKRLRNYKKAIDLYFEAGKQKKAQAVAEAHGQATYMFDKLVSTNNSTDLSRFLNAVSGNSDLQPEYVLENLSSDLHVNEITAFLIKFTTHSLNKVQVSNSLDAVSRRALAQESIQIAAKKRNHVTITNLDACVICHKRLGRAVTCIVNDQAMHYTCFKNRKH